jgi:hypothetical protein
MRAGVCMHACERACMYACVRACMDVCMRACVHGVCLGGPFLKANGGYHISVTYTYLSPQSLEADGCVCTWAAWVIDNVACRHACIHVCMCVCVHVCR